MADEDEISLVELVSILWRRKASVLIFVALSLIGGCTYLVVTPDVYKAEAIILPLQGRSTIALPSNLLGLEGLKEMIGETMPGIVEAPSASRIRSLLTSRRLNLQLVEKFDLLPILFPEQWDKSKLNWKENENSIKPTSFVINSIKKILGIKPNFINAHPSSLDGAELLQTKVAVTNVKKENLIMIEFEDYDPSFTQLMINRYIDSLDEYLRYEAISRAVDSKNYINTLLQAQVNDLVKKRLEELSLAFSEQELYAKMKSSFLFEVIDPPLLPEKPIKPKRPLIMALTMISSLLSGILMAFLLEGLKKYKGMASNQNL